jgi:hypothetical protein
VKSALFRYRFMASVVGVLLVVLILIGVPLANFDGSSMWGVFPATPSLVTEGSDAQRLGEAITTYLGVAHGWLYMIFLLAAFVLSRKARWDILHAGDPGVRHRAAAVLLGRAPRHRPGPRRAPRARHDQGLTSP